MKRKAYRSTEVKQVLLEQVLRVAPPGPVSIGLDVGKFEIFVVVRWADGTFERPWKAANPSEVEFLVGVLVVLAAARVVTVSMESTGTYGDALRGKLSAAGLVLQRVGGKAASDYAEIFDGVPSQHDGKDAAVIAELAAFGKSRPWPYREPSEADAAIAYWVNWLDAQQSIQKLWAGRLEALLARHWPECTRLLKLNSVTLLSALAHYGGPAKLAQDPSASAQLAKWGHGHLSPTKIALVVASAAQTVGTLQVAREAQQMQEYARLALGAYRESEQARGRLAEAAAENEVLKRQALVVGEATACVLWVALGDPRDYPCGEAYRKAMGLNLTERSSGKYQGRLKITKRGPSIVRRWMYFAAMRTVQDAPVRCWYEAKKAKDKACGMGALIAVMRKLALASYAVGARGDAFDPARLFPGKSIVSRSGRTCQAAAKS
jgi:transposase